ncbi:putative PABC (PABP) domain-containing protein [Helianthus annuus]|nr:putative PABC (PABP) domain-containing protein [Helianthus annuus]
MGPTPIVLAGASCMPMFPPGLGQQFFYSQAQPTFIPPQVISILLLLSITLLRKTENYFWSYFYFFFGNTWIAWFWALISTCSRSAWTASRWKPCWFSWAADSATAYSSYAATGMRPNGSPMPNFYMPMVQPGQHGPCPRGSRAGVPGLQIQQQPVFLMQQQTVPYGRMSHHAPMSYRYDAGNVMQLSDAGGSSALANAFPTEQRTMLGKNLYPLAEQRFFGGRSYHEH